MFLEQEDCGILCPSSFPSISSRGWAFCCLEKLGVGVGRIVCEEKLSKQGFARKTCGFFSNEDALSQWDCSSGQT